MTSTRRSATEIIDGEVRELIRRRGIDPFQDPAAVRRLIDEVLSDYGERALAGSLPVVADASGIAKQIFDAVAGLGPLQRFIDDPRVEEIWVNGPGRVFVAREGRSELTTAILTKDQLTELCERMLKNTGRRVDLSTPFVDASLPDGSRLHIAIPDITREHWAVNIRKFVVRAQALEQLVELGTLTAHAARFLDAAVLAGLNIIVAGGTQAGKTTLLTCLANTIPAADRVISCEEVFELKLTLPDWVAMQTRQPNLEGNGAIELRRLVTEALRMRPSRIIVGEVRQAECLDLLIALNAGLPGMCSIHASSAREAITKLCTLPLLAGENISSAFVVPTVASSVDIVVHVETTSSGQRRVTEIVGVSGRVEGSTIETSELFTTRNGRVVRAEGFPPSMDRFTSNNVDIVAILNDAPNTHPNRIAAVPRPPTPTEQTTDWRPSIESAAEITGAHPRVNGRAPMPHRRPTPAGQGAEQVTEVTGEIPRWRPDGYQEHEQSTMITPLLTSPPTQPDYLGGQRRPTEALPVLSAPADAGPNQMPGPYPPRLPHPAPRPSPYPADSTDREN